jgi:hypothetical protein
MSRRRRGQDDRPPRMALNLRHASDEFPLAHWAPSNEHLVIMSGDNIIGSLQKLNSGTTGDRWQWSITAIAETRPAGPKPARKRRPNSPKPGALD